MNVKKLPLRTFFTIAIAKLSIRILRILKLGGTTLPGKIALFFHPQLLKVLSQRLEQIFVVTGTNGKTTTCRMIASVLQQSNIPFFMNQSGANLSSGILTTLIEHVGWNLRYSKKTALLEMDEAAFAKISDSVNPQYILITNFFRDQLDRYGELYTTVSNVKNGITKLKDPILFVNADDSLSVHISRETLKKTYFYGFSKTATFQSSNTLSDAAYCVYCMHKYRYTYQIFGHLGGFYCDHCGFKSPQAQVACTQILQQTQRSLSIEVSFLEKDASQQNDASREKDASLETVASQQTDATQKTDASQQTDALKETVASQQTDDSLYSDNARHTFQINLPGTYNIYNALGTIALAKALSISSATIEEGLLNVQSGFGRMEMIHLQDRYLQMILVKNPTGFDQVLEYLIQNHTKTPIVFLINDNLADGTDISWLWDVHFEQLQQIQASTPRFICSGQRKEDMALRLKYAGIDAEKISTLDSFEAVLQEALLHTSPGETFIVCPTYTAMLAFRGALSKKYALKEFWRS